LGLGWLIFIFGVVTSDFWVAEAYPFLSSYVTPHFAFSLALMLWLLIPVSYRQKGSDDSQHLNWIRWLLVFLASGILAVMSPFAVVLVLAVQGLLLVWAWLDQHRVQSQLTRVSIFGRSETRGLLIEWILIFAAGFPVLTYSVMAMRLDPVLAAWNAQNLTPSPPVWDLLLAFSPALVLSIPGAWYVLRTDQQAARVLVVWLVLAFGLIYFPFSLQRRFLIGLYVPLACLAGFGLEALESHLKDRMRIIKVGVIALSLPSVMLVLLLGQFGALTHDPLLYLKSGEAEALEWLEKNSGSDALILAGPRMGMYIPGRTGRRVIYGHPFETVNAEAQKVAVNQFFQNASSDPEAASIFIDNRGVDYIFMGPDELALGQIAHLPGLKVVYDQNGVQIFQVIEP
jgi:hypothetical protein